MLGSTSEAAAMQGFSELVEFSRFRKAMSGDSKDGGREGVDEVGEGGDGEGG